MVFFDFVELFFEMGEVSRADIDFLLGVLDLFVQDEFGGFVELAFDSVSADLLVDDEGEFLGD